MTFVMGLRMYNEHETESLPALQVPMVFSNSVGVVLTCSFQRRFIKWSSPAVWYWEHGHPFRAMP